MKFLSLIFVFILMFSSCKKSSTQRSPASSSSISGLKIKWADNIVSNGNGLSIKVSNSANQLFGGSSSLIDSLANQWNNSDSQHNFIKVPLQIVSANKTYSTTDGYRDNELGIYTNSNWFSTVSSSALAVTLFSGIKRNPGTSNEYLELTHADIVVNTRDFNFSPQVDSIRNAASVNQLHNSYDIQSVILHELGHFLGMSHQNNSSIPSVMQPSLNFSQEKRILQKYDTDKIKSTYNLSSSNTTGAAVLNMAFKPSTNDSFSMPIEESLNDSNLFVGQMELHKNGLCRLIINGQIIKTFHHNHHLLNHQMN